MIENWDLVSRIDHETGNVHFSLLIDGTEHDARLISKKLTGYVRATEPAEAPFVYAFKLPSNLDEATQDKIRAAVREGVELTNKVNQFMPGGVLGDPLFNSTTSQEDKDFPTFLTLDPSESFFGSSGSEQPKQKADINLDFVEQLSLGDDLPKPEAHVISLDRTPEPAEEAIQTPPDHATPVSQPLTPSAPEEPFVEQPSAQPPQAGLPPRTPTEQEVSAPQMQPEKPIPETEDLIPQVRVRTAGFENEPPVETPPPLPEASLAKNDVPPAKEPETPPAQPHPADTEPVSEGPAEAEEKSPVFTDQDMLISDMEDTLLGKNPVPLEDIFAAETKYDMFVDLQKEAQNQVSQAQRENKWNQAADDNTNKEFDIFAQNLKEQTSVIDIAQLQEMLDQMPPENSDSIQREVEHFQAQTVPAGSADPEHRPTPKDPLPEDDLPAITLRAAPLVTDLETDSVQDPVPPQESDRGNSLPSSLPAKEPTAEKTASKETITMEDKNAKTTFRLKLKTPAAKQPLPPAPKPAAPRPPVPAAPVPKKPAIPASPDNFQTENPNLEKTKTIDHSIQLPLSELKKHTWPLEIPLIPTYTLNNMVMSVNRFAHATAISVIESPGKLYNPLVFHGSTGTGKTHFLNAMAYALSQKFGQPNIFMTNGVRLSRGVQRYIMEGKIEKFDQFMATVKVLLIDDIHLLAINEQNRAYISKLLNTFLKEHKQIIITSKYPPESLEKLEELIKFKLDSGWISELKPATGSAYTKIVKKMLIDNNVDLTETQMNQFFTTKNMTLGTVMRSIRRLKALENLLPQNDNTTLSQPAILEKLLPVKGEDTSSAILSVDPSTITSIVQQGNGEWGRIGFFYPSNCSEQMNWMVYALQQRSKELGIPSNFEIVVRSSYATENIISSAFKIANLCDNKKLKGAVILGPRPGTCDPSVRENFYDILTHMLEVMLIRCGIINFEDVRMPSTYVKLLSELMR